jgi:hypothetical protein
LKKYSLRDFLKPFELVPPRLMADDVSLRAIFALSFSSLVPGESFGESQFSVVSDVASTNPF